MKLTEIFRMTVKKLQESKELLVVYPRLVNKLELEYMKEFQKFCSVVHDYLAGPKSKEAWTVEHAKELQHELSEFDHYGFLSWLKKDVDESIEAHEKMTNAKDYLKQNHHHISSKTDELAAALMAGDYDAAHSTAEALNAIIDLVDAHVDINAKLKSSVKNKFTLNPTIFGSNAFLDTVNAEDYQKVVELDLSQQWFTYLDFPKAMLESDYHYVLFFMQNLKDNPKPVRINSKFDFRQFVQGANAGKPEYEELAKLFDNYLHGNDKSLIPRILQLVNGSPTLRAANEKAKKRIKTVYRGLGFGNDDGSFSRSEIMKQEKEQRFVATSEHHSAAMNFALMKGHLTSGRNSEIGYMLTYEVTPEAILLDTSIFKTIYGESEILIDATKATLKDMEEV